MKIDPVKQNPCVPSPCGPNSICREIRQQAVCSCVSGFLGAPPACRPECTISSDCQLTEACSNQKCINPCLGSCGFKAVCHVINHNPLCSCPPEMTGDPFVQCLIKRKTFPDTFLFIAKYRLETYAFKIVNDVSFNNHIFFLSTSTCNTRKSVSTISLWC